ncbi:MAG TPA: ATP synthase F1 subunit delta [Kofleriaceae bacterium]|nr:ATP synthase F1 subunit delta [Kofleriaceae bacterium]
MVTGSLARRYAKAIFDIGSQQGDLAKLGQDLRSLAKAMNESKELGTALTNPAIRRSDRKKVIDGLLQSIGVQTASRNLVYILLEGERMGTVPGISRALDEMIEAKAGRVTAEVVSAKPLGSDQLSQINAALEKLSGKKVSVTTRQDPELLGGVIAKVGDTVYDGSLRTQLRTLRDELSK